MAEIPSELAQSIQSGDCVLWAGAGFGTLLGRPGWAELLDQLVPECPEPVQAQLRDLLEQGRLRTVLSYVHRHLGDEPLARLLQRVSAQTDGSAPQNGANALVKMPWRACFATTYADVLYQIFNGAGQNLDVISHTDVHHLSLRDYKNPFILRTPPTGRSMRADNVFFELVEEVVRTRTILFLGFDIDDPDLFQILDLLGRVGRGNTHFAWLPFVTDAEAEEIREQYGIQVLQAPGEIALPKAFEELVDACSTAPPKPSDAEGELSVLDLARALKGVDIRADLALDTALSLDVHEIEELVEHLPGGSLSHVDPGTMLRLGCVMLAHGRLDKARKEFQQVIARGVGREYQNVARFNLAVVSFMGGDAYAAVEGFTDVAEADRTMALVPPRFQIVEVLGRDGTRMLFSVRDRETEGHLDIAVSTLARPVGAYEQAHFHTEVKRLMTINHAAVGKIRGGFADGHLFGVMSESAPGFVLADTVGKDERLTLERTLEIVGPVLDGLAACHQAGAIHRNINPRQIVMTPDGPILRGFGFPPVVSYHRASVRQSNVGYMAPELWRGAEPTPASDVYSIAAVTYRCLTGIAPAGSVPAVSGFSDDLDPRLDELMRRALHPDPLRRPPPAQLRQELQLILTSPRPEPTSEAEAAAATEELSRRESALSKRELEIGKSEEAVREREASLEQRELGVREREANIDARGATAEAAASADAADLAEAVTRAQQELETRESAVAQREAALKEAEATVQARAEQDLEKTGDAVAASEAIAVRERELSEREQGVKAAEQALLAREAALAEREAAVAKAEEEVKAAVPAGTPEEGSIPPSSQIRIPEDPDDLEAWAWILERKPTHAEAREAVERIEQEARENNRWDRVAEVLNVRAQNSQVQQERIDLLRELATLFEEALGAPANAFTTLQALMEEVAVPVQVELLDDLRRLGELTGNWAGLANSITIVAGRVADSDRQAGLYGDLGRIYADQLGAGDQAVACYAKALELTPESRELFDAAIPLYRRLDRHAELTAALVSVADLASGDERHEYLFEAAQLLEHELGDEDGSFAILEVVRGEAPNHAKVMEAGELLARKLDQWEPLVDILVSRADQALDDSEAAELRREAASLAIEKLGDDATAIAQYKVLVERHQSDRAAAQTLVELLRKAADRDASQREALIDATYHLTELTDASDEKVALLEQCAALLDKESDGGDRAADCREQIMATIPVDQTAAREAATALERYYRAQEAHNALAELYLRQGQAAAADAGFRRDAWQQLFALRTGPLDDDAGAMEALEALTELDPENTKWRDDLLARYLEAGEFEKAGPIIRAQVDAETDPTRKADLLIRGATLRQQIGKEEAAIEALQEALALDASRTDGWQALRELYLQHQQPLKALEAQVEAARSTNNALEKTRLLFEAAQDCFGRLQEPERGLPLLEEVVELDPDHREATQMLLDRLVAAGDLARAWPVAQTFVRQARSQAADDRALNLHALGVAGRCALAVDDTDKAVEYLEKAKALDASDVEVMRLLADLHLNAGRFDEALTNYQSVVLGAGDRLKASEQSSLYVSMARSCIGMDQKKKGVQMAERALELDGDAEEATRLVVQLTEEVGTAADKVKSKRRMVDWLWRRAQDTHDEAAKAKLDDERVDQLRGIAELQAEELNLPEEAVRTLEEVLDVRPGDPAVLHRILDLFTETGRWRDATKVLERLAEGQESGVTRAKYLYAGAAIMRDQLGDHDGAIEWFRNTMSADPGHDKSFRGLTELLSKSRLWRDLTRVVRERLKALPDTATAEERVELLDQLGDVYEQHLDDPVTAFAAYEQVVALMAGSAGVDPDRLLERRRKVLDLAISLGDDQLDKAVNQAHAVIVARPMEFDNYHRLFELYVRQGDADAARCMARGLKFLKQASEAELRIADATGEGLVQARGTVPRDMWRSAVYHPLENPRLSDVFSVIWPMVAAREGRTHKHFGFTRDDREQVSLQAPQALARFLAYACQVLDAPLPDLFFRPEDKGSLTTAALADLEGGQVRTVYPSVIAARDALGKQSDHAWAFRAGRAVARARPEHILSAVIPSGTSLRHAVYGAVMVALPEVAIPAELKDGAQAYAQEIQRYLPPARVDRLKTLVSRLIEGSSADTKAWMQGVDHTVTRVGFVLSDDLETASRIVTQEKDVGATVDAKDRMKDLISYSVSAPYIKLRKALKFV